MISTGFPPDGETLNAICAELAAATDDDEHSPADDDPLGGIFYTVEQRRTALAEYLRTRTRMPAPDVDLQWRAGTRKIPAARGAAAPAGQSYVHFGALQIETGARPNAQNRIVACSFANARAAYGAEFARAVQAAGALPKTPSARLTVAFQNCGVFVYVPAGMRCSEPLALVWNYPQGSAEAVFPYILVYVDTGAQVEIIERHIGQGDTFLCGAVQVVAAPRARCTYVVLQQTGETAVVQHTRTVRAAANARVCYVQAELGANFSRVRLHNDCAGTGAEITHAFLSLRADLQRGDVHVTTRHRARTTASRQIRRFVLGGRSRMRSTEFIHAQPGAGARNDTSTEALLFSRNAAFECEPFRSISQASVSASERVAVGTLDEETIFYLRTRGIPLREARRMTALAFFEPAIVFAPSEELRNEIRTALDDEIDRVTGLADES